MVAALFRLKKGEFMGRGARPINGKAGIYVALAADWGE
jgi:hypothetical protein